MQTRYHAECVYNISLLKLKRVYTMSCQQAYSICVSMTYYWTVARKYLMKVRTGEVPRNPSAGGGRGRLALSWLTRSKSALTTETKTWL